MKIRSIDGSLTVNDGQEVPVSKGIEVGGFVFVSGQLAYDENGQFVSSSVAEETRSVIANIERVLNKAGCGLEDVVKCTCWLSDKTYFDEFNGEYMRHFKDPRPARSTVEAGLMFGAKVEIEAIAIVPSD